MVEGRCFQVTGQVTRQLIADVYSDIRPIRRGHITIKPRRSGGKSRSKTKTAKQRDYKKEYRDFHGKPEQIKKRDMRNAARRKMGLKVGDSREVDHKVPLSKGGSNSKRNLRIVTRRTNRTKGVKR